MRNFFGSPSNGSFSGVASNCASCSALRIGSWTCPVLSPLPTSLTESPIGTATITRTGSGKIGPRTMTFGLSFAMLSFKTDLYVQLLNLGGPLHDEGEAGLDLLAHEGLNAGLGAGGVTNGHPQERAATGVKRRFLERLRVHLS